MSHTRRFITLLALTTIATTAICKENPTKKQAPIKSNKVVNKYGIDLVGTEMKPCHKINKAKTRQFSRCYNQGKHILRIGRRVKHHMQFKCKLKVGETLIYNSRKICLSHYQQMYIESN